MTNKEKYDKIFMETFNIPAERLPGLKYQSIKEWDSVGHMELVSELEDAFDIEIETDDVIDFSGYEKGMEIIGEKYNVKFE